jgi:DivIVA domain-containing protein
MAWRDIERLRFQGFTVARRGYDRREVDKFLAALGDWIETDAAKDLGASYPQARLISGGQMLSASASSLPS